MLKPMSIMLCFSMLIAILTALSPCFANSRTPRQARETTDAAESNSTTINVDGRRYPFTAAGVQAAIEVGCKDNAPGKVILPGRTISNIQTRIVLHSSNCTIEGKGKNVTVLQASPIYSSGAILATGNNISNLRLINFGVDGNRSNNPKIYDCMDISGTDITLEDLRISNCRNQGLLLFGASHHVRISRSEFDHNGRDIFIEGTGGIRITPEGANSISDIQVGPGNSIHDNNVGIAILPPSSRSNETRDITVLEDEIYSNASDAVVVTANLPTGGSIADFSAMNNTIWCNGWTGEPFPGCSPGFLQNGSASSSGVGVDLIQLGGGLMQRPVIKGNHMHDNTYEGVALTTYCWSRVRTSGKKVEQTGPSSFTHAACPFNLEWKAGEPVTINGSIFLIASVRGDTSLELQSSAGSLQDAGFAGNSPMHAVISNNEVVHDGSGKVGPCFFDSWTSDVSFSDNFAKDCNLEGYVAGGSSIVFRRDIAISNGKGGAAGRNNGFNLTECMDCLLEGIIADDPESTPSQTIGLLLGPGTSNTITSAPALHGSKSEYIDRGKHNIRK